jgi:hypothetical protein
MPKLTVEDIVPGDLYVLTDPTFSSWIGLVAKAAYRYGHSSTHYVFELIELTDGTRGYKTGAQLPLNVKRFERYQPSASDQLFN